MPTSLDPQLIASRPVSSLRGGAVAQLLFVVVGRSVGWLVADSHRRLELPTDTRYSQPARHCTHRRKTIALRPSADETTSVVFVLDLATATLAGGRLPHHSSRCAKGSGGQAMLSSPFQQRAQDFVFKAPNGGVNWAFLIEISRRCGT